MSDKLEFTFDATALGSSACILKLKRIVVGEFDENNVPAPEGGYKTTLSSAIVYGIALHKFVDVMYKTAGDIISARKSSLDLFRMKKIPNPKKPYLDDEKHFLTVCTMLWLDYIEKDDKTEVLQLQQECWYCKGKGTVPKGKHIIDSLYEIEQIPCAHCQGKRTILGPSTEITFRILIYEDDLCRIYLAGTLDTLLKIVNGCYAIRDWKTTSSWADEYFVQYELSRQLRVYSLALKLMAQQHPESTIGKIGATRFGAFIDGIFLKSKVSDVEFKRSDVMHFHDDLGNFHAMLLEFCKKFSDHVKNKYWPKQGILNGECLGRYGYKCMFWNVCKSNDTVAKVLLKRDFQRKVYDPLSFNEE